jgi:GH35 family endo-1,4-beta-xylanase
MIAIVLFLLVSCSSTSSFTPINTLKAETPTTASLITPITPTATHMIIAVPTATFIPTIQVGKLIVPDPHFTNPEFFDSMQPDGVIFQFVNSMKLVGIDINSQKIINNLAFEQKTSSEKQPFIIAYYDLNPASNKTGDILKGKIPFFIATRGESGGWSWMKASPGNLARLSGYAIGTVFEPSNLNEPKYNDFILNFSNIVENGFWDRVFKSDITVDQAIDKLKQIRSTTSSGDLNPDSIFDFSEYDSLVKYANEHDMQIECQPLFAPWLFSDQIKQDLVSGRLSEADFESYLQFYTKTVVGRYDGHIDPQLKVNSWVVANEVTTHWMWGNAQTKNFISRVINDGILARMFITAKKVNPNASFLISEDHLLEDSEGDLRTNLIKAIDIMKNQGATIDGIAMQNHLWLGRPLLSSSKMENFFQQLEKKNLTISYNEITISISQQNQYTDEKVSTPFTDPFLKQAQFLRDILNPMISQGRSTIIFFSIVDTPGPFDKYNLNDSAAKAEMFGTGDAESFTSDTKLEARPMYYVLLQFLMERCK